MEHYKKKFGAQRTQMMIPAMIERGKADGIKFSYAGKVGNTMAGHRLVEWSKQFGKHEQLMEEVGRPLACSFDWVADPAVSAVQLFTRYFEQEQDVADTDTLVAAAKKVGLDGDAAAKFLKTSEGKEEVMASVQEVGLLLCVPSVSTLPLPIALLTRLLHLLLLIRRTPTT